MRYFDIFSSLSVDIVEHFRTRQKNGWGRSVTMSEFPFSSHSNDDMEEGDPGSDSDFEIDTKKEVSNMTHNNGC